MVSPRVGEEDLVGVRDVHVVARHRQDDRRRRHANMVGGCICPGRMRAAMRRPNEGGALTEAIRPYRVDVADAVLDDLRDRLARTRWPDQIPGREWDYGTDLVTLQELCAYWRDGFDWRAAEAGSERMAAVRDGHRRPARALRPRPIAGAGRAADRDHPRLARLDRRVPQGPGAASPIRSPTAVTPPTRSTSWHRRCPATASAGPRRGRAVDIRTVAEVNAALMAPTRLRPLRRARGRLGRHRHVAARPHRRAAPRRHPREHGRGAAPEGRRHHGRCAA